nr:IS4 family transposase [Paraburkholderia sprentiae]
MNVGKTLFAQVMEFVPYGRRLAASSSDIAATRGRMLECADLFRIMVFAQLTWRESMRDIEARLSANRDKLFDMRLKNVPALSTLSDALNLRDWSIYHALAMRLVTRARALYATQPLDIDLDATVYALDATTIDLRLSLFEWAPFRTTKAAVKMHTLLDLRGAIRAFIHISDGKMHEVGVLNFLPIEAGTFHVMERGYLDFAPLFELHQAGAFFVARAKRNMNACRVYSDATDRSTGVICDQSIA